MMTRLRMRVLCPVFDYVQYSVQRNDNGRHRRRPVLVNLSADGGSTDLAKGVARDDRTWSVLHRNRPLRRADVQR